MFRTRQERTFRGPEEHHAFSQNKSKKDKEMPPYIKRCHFRAVCSWRCTQLPAGKGIKTVCEYTTNFTDTEEKWWLQISMLTAWCMMYRFYSYNITVWKVSNRPWIDWKTSGIGGTNLHVEGQRQMLLRLYKVPDVWISCTWQIFVS
jgi:hypothetical protein